MAKYDFGWGKAYAVECPELDAFIGDIVSVCKKHGVGIDVDRGSYDDRARIAIVPFDRADFDFITDDLEEYRGGVPWLDKAKALYRERYDSHRAAEDAARTEQNRLAEEAKAKLILENGVIVAGKHYKLTPV